MPKQKWLLFAIGAVLLLLGGVGSLLWYDANHFSINLGNEQLSDAQIALKGSIGQAIFSPLSRNAATSRNDLDSVLAPRSSASKGLIDDYRRNPQEYKRYAQMLDTALSARRVGDAVLNLTSSEIPRSSAQLAMDSHAKVDSWGSPFCIVPLVGRLAVVSGGPSNTPCNALPLSVEQLNRSERSVFAGPSESVIVILSKK